MLLLFCFIMIGMTGCGKQERKEVSVYIADDGTLAVSGLEADVETKINEYLQVETQQILAVYKENIGVDSFFQTQMLQYEVSGSYLSIYCELWTESLWDKASFGLYGGKYCFYFTLMEGFYW